MNSNQVFAVFNRRASSSSLAELSIHLLEEQKQVWTQLANGYASLGSVKIREVRSSGYSVYFQFNPGRIISTGAKVDEKTIRERKCFLCVQNLPPMQKGILYEGEYLVLCNPAPIFSQHYTISNANHIVQAIEPNVTTFLNLARDLGPTFTVFYNGPKCGASAPDHLHFQANPTGTIPVENDCLNEDLRVFRKKMDGVALFTLKEYGREVIALESNEQQQLEQVFLKLIGAMRSVNGTNEEPMMNVLCSFKDGGWRMIVFPRKKHRPDAYYKEGEEKILISPAAVDIGGLVITPLEKDFNRVDPEMIKGIFKEVSVEKEKMEEILNNI